MGTQRLIRRGHLYLKLGSKLRLRMKHHTVVTMLNQFFQTEKEREYIVVYKSLNRT